MKTRYSSALIILLAASLVVCACGESAGGRVRPVPVPSPAPVVSADATRSMTFWSAGNTAFKCAYDPGTFSLTPYGGELRIPAGNATYFETPLSIPSLVNARPCTFRSVYLLWNAPAGCSIESVIVWSGGAFVRDVPVGEPGTGEDQRLTVDLGAPYPVLQGISADWKVNNTAGNEGTCTVLAYGTRIKY